MNRVGDLYSEVVILLADEDYREPESKSLPPAGLGRLNRKMNESVTGRALPYDQEKGLDQNTHGEPLEESEVKHKNKGVVSPKSLVMLLQRKSNLGPLIKNLHLCRWIICMYKCTHSICMKNYTYKLEIKLL